MLRCPVAVMFVLLLAVPAMADSWTVTELTDNALDDKTPRVSGIGVVWSGNDGSDYEIYVWDGSATTQLTDNDLDDQNPAISGNTIVWQQHDGNDFEIMKATRNAAVPVPSAALAGLGLLAALGFRRRRP